MEALVLRMRNWIAVAIANGADRPGKRYRPPLAPRARDGHVACQAINFVRAVFPQLGDLAIFPDQQRGLETSAHPGAIGTLKQRVYAFHEWVLKNATGPRDVHHTWSAETRKLLCP
jgi:hypothetical protein